MEALLSYYDEANTGNAESQFQLANVYKNNFRDINKYKQWLTKSAKANHFQAQYDLGILYLKNGDITQSSHWLNLAYTNTQNTLTISLQNSIEISMKDPKYMNLLFDP